MKLSCKFSRHNVVHHAHQAQSCVEKGLGKRGGRRWKKSQIIWVQKRGGERNGRNKKQISYMDDSWDSSTSTAWRTKRKTKKKKSPNNWDQRFKSHQIPKFLIPGNSENPRQPHSRAACVSTESTLSFRPTHYTSHARCTYSGSLYWTMRSRAGERKESTDMMPTGSFDECR